MKWHPKRPGELVSCSIDGSVVTWNATKGRALAKQRFVLTAGEFVNPPMAHCVDVSDDGRLVGVALGSGSVAVLNWKGLMRRTEMTISDGSHSAAASAVKFSRFGQSSPRSTLISGGNDMRVIVWDAIGATKLSEFSTGDVKVNSLATDSNTIFVCGNSSSLLVIPVR